MFGKEKNDVLSRTTNKLHRKFRRKTSILRSSPDFLIVGAQKSGTTSLFHYLKQHPQIFPSQVKEVHYFNGGLNPDVDNFDRGELWYRSYFPFNIVKLWGVKTFEATPGYIFNPLASKRIYDYNSEIKIIVLLRNPTDRAISHYFHESQANRENLPLMEALKEEENRLENVVFEEKYKSLSFINHSYKMRGLYKKQIERYLKYFPMNQLHIIKSEEFFVKPRQTLESVFKFIGIANNASDIKLKPYNVTKSKTYISQDTYNYLNNYFYTPNQELYEYLDRDFDW